MDVLSWIFLHITVFLILILYNNCLRRKKSNQMTKCICVRSQLGLCGTQLWHDPALVGLGPTWAGRVIAWLPNTSIHWCQDYRDLSIFLELNIFHSTGWLSLKHKSFYCKEWKLLSPNCSPKIGIGGTTTKTTTIKSTTTEASGTKKIYI